MSISRVDSVTALRATTPAAGDLAELTGYYNPGDGGGGEFYWDSTSVLTDNGGTIIKATPATGRWIRVFQQAVNVQWFGAKGDGSTDDTSAINAAIGAITAGEVVFQPNLTYVISSTLTLSYPITIDLCGAILQFPSSVSATNVAAFTVSHDNVTIKNGTINGTYNPSSDVPSPGVGPYGISNNAGKAYLVVDRLTISNVQNYGIIASNGLSPRITNCHFINTGYISFFSSNTATGVIDGGLLEGNIFDRSGINAANIVQPAVSIRGDNSSGLVYTSDWVIANNKFMTPPSPSSNTVSGMEARYMIDSTISNNVYVNGSLGLSIVGSANVTASANTAYNCSNGLELAGCTYCTLDGNIVNGNSLAGSVGILIDGAYPSASEYNTISNNNVSGVKSSGIEIYLGAANNTIIGGTIVQATSGQACINIIGAQSTLITGVLMYGQTTGSAGVLLDNSHIGTNSAYIINGTIINGCRFDSLASQAISIYASAGGTISGLRFTNNFSTGTMLGTTLSGGATLSTPYYYGNSPEIIGSKVILATGTNASAGTATMTAGTVTVSNTLVTSNSLIMLSVSATGGTQGILSYTKTAGTSFTIHSTSATDTSTVAWVIVN